MSILNINKGKIKGLIKTTHLDTEELYIATVSSTGIVWFLTSMPFGFDFTLAWLPVKVNSNTRIIDVKTGSAQISDKDDKRNVMSQKFRLTNISENSYILDEINQPIIQLKNKKIEQKVKQPGTKFGVISYLPNTQTDIVQAFQFVQFKTFNNFNLKNNQLFTNVIYKGNVIHNTKNLFDINGTTISIGAYLFQPDISTLQNGIATKFVYDGTEHIPVLAFNNSAIFINPVEISDPDNCNINFSGDTRDLMANDIRVCLGLEESLEEYCDSVGLDKCNFFTNIRDCEVGISYLYCNKGIQCSGNCKSGCSFGGFCEYNIKTNSFQCMSIRPPSGLLANIVPIPEPIIPKPLPLQPSLQPLNPSLALLLIPDSPIDIPIAPIFPSKKTKNVFIIGGIIFIIILIIFIVIVVYFANNKT